MHFNTSEIMRLLREEEDASNIMNIIDVKWLNVACAPFLCALENIKF